MNSHQQSKTQHWRAMFVLTFTVSLLFATTLTTFGQTSMTTLKPHLKSAPTASSDPEEVYFNSEAREVKSPSSLAPEQLSATSSGRAVSVLFNSARVELQTDSDPMVATWSGTITLPTNSAAKPNARSYLQDIRGSVNKSADTRVTIFLELGGKSFMAEFPYGTKHMGNILRRFISTIKPGSATRYTASILIFAERRNPKSAVLVDIDSLDIAAR
jgi:hypothetical protein